MLLHAAPLLPANAQDDTLEVALPEIEIQASRSTETEATAPFSVAVLARSTQSVALEPGTSLTSTLRGIPGIVLNDRSHFALGERLVIRGMGWRSPFGVRGVQVLLDGIPLTLPDGQSVLDIAAPSMLRGAEVMRGPSSSLWGNGSGGVVFLSSAASVDSTSIRLRAMGGSFNERQFAGEATLPLGKHNLHVYASDIQRDGYRRHSAGGFTRGGLQGRFVIGSRTTLQMLAAVADQDVLHPGSLTAEQAAEDPRQADSRYANTTSGKKSTQIQGGATLHHASSLGTLSVTGYGITRRLRNPLPFAFIDLDRTAGGLRLHLQDQSGRLGWAIGADAGYQDDVRLNFNNDNGKPGNERRLDQNETVRNIAAFGRLRFSLSSRLDATASVRYDNTHFEMQDRLLENGDQSGSRTFSAWSPSIGLAYRFQGALLFANYSSAFETPTTTELVNRPDTDGGFNPNLEPQRTQGVEMGARGRLPDAPLRYDVALFRLYIEDRLLPAQSDDGRTYFQNAGRNTHTGVEIALGWTPSPATSVMLSYTGSHFVFKESALLDNHIPGVPDHLLSASIRSVRRGFWGEVALHFASDAFTNDDNTSQNKSYLVADIYVGHANLHLARTRIQPFLKLGNVLDATYNGSIVVNARGGRYYEPAPGRTLHAGINVSI